MCMHMHHLLSTYCLLWYVFRDSTSQVVPYSVFVLKCRISVDLPYANYSYDCFSPESGKADLTSQAIF